MPRHDQKAYASVIARIPQELADQVKQYASQHRCTVSELIRDGLEMRLESGEVPGRSTASRTNHGDEVLHEVLQVIPEVVHTLTPLLLAQIQDMMRTTVTEVLHGTPKVIHGHTRAEPPSTRSTGGGTTEVLPHGDAFDPAKYYLGKLCPHGHQYGDTGMSLRRKHNHACHVCENEQKRERRARQKAHAG